MKGAAKSCPLLLYKKIHKSKNPENKLGRTTHEIKLSIKKENGKSRKCGRSLFLLTNRALIQRLSQGKVATGVDRANLHNSTKVKSKS